MKILGFLLASALVLAAHSASAAMKLMLLSVPAGNMVAALVALDQGFFAKHDLDVTFSAAQNGSTIPAALMAGAADIGGPSPTVFLQADDAGLDLVIVAGTLREPQRHGENGALAATGSGIKGPADLKGRKVGVPGFGGIFEIVAKKWVAESGVDYRDVHWVELLFPQQADGLKSGLVDAVTSINPFYSRITDGKIGYPIGDIEDILPAGAAPIVLVARRSWVKDNSAALAAFRAGLADGAAYASDPARAGPVRTTILKWTKLPPQAAATVKIPLNIDPRATPDNIAFWIDVAHEQGVIKGKPDPASLIAP